jgi:archaellum component FlaF (FlaF/FlaG flagellin family)
MRQIALLITMLLSISVLYAQENKKETDVEDALSKWSIRSSYQMGNGSIARNNSTGYTLNTSNFICLLEYK